jgi:trimeric autotransporter adhesin
MKAQRNRSICIPPLVLLLMVFSPHICQGGAILDNILTNFWYPDGYVYAIAEVDGVVYIGGDFHYVGPETGPNAFLDSATGARDDSYPKANGRINAAISDGAGGLFVGGAFSEIGGLERRGLAHILPDKTVDPSWDAPVFPGSVSALLLIGDTLYIAGGFLSIGITPRNSLGAVSASTGAVLPWNPNPSSVSFVQINDVASIGSTIYIGGNFTSIGGQMRTNLAAVDASGNALAFNPNPNFPPVALAAGGSTIYSAGVFTRIGGQMRTNLAALDATTGSALAWPNDRPNNQVLSLSLAGNILYVGGFFSALGSASRSGLGALDTTTGNATSWNPGSGIVGNPNAPNAYSVAASGSAVYVGGGFTLCGGQPRLRIAAVNTSNGNALPDFDPGANWIVRRVIPLGNRVLVSGEFGSIGGVKRNNIAALDATTGAATSWDASTEYYGRIYSIVPSNSVLFVGGAYTNIGGQARHSIAALNTTTGAATPWNPNPIVAPNAINNINAMVLAGDILYVAGGHGPMGGALRTNAVALNTTTALATPWNPFPNSFVYTLAQGNGVIYAGGTFSRIGGVQMTNIAALDPTTGAATAWNARCNLPVWAVAVNGDSLYAGGTFRRIGGQNRTNFAAVSTVTGDLLSFPNPELSFAGAGVFALGLRGTEALLVGGSMFFDIDALRLLEVELASGDRTGWSPGPERPTAQLGSGYVRAIKVGADKIYVGGEFQGGFAAYGFAGPPAQLVMPARTMSGFQFRLLGTDGLQYTIEATSDFSFWDFLQTVTPVNGFVDVLDSNASFYEQRFYRAYSQ